MDVWLVNAWPEAFFFFFFFFFKMGQMARLFFLTFLLLIVIKPKMVYSNTKNKKITCVI